MKAANTINFTSLANIPGDRKITYASFACDHRPLKEEKWRIKSVLGGDRLPYSSYYSSLVADIIEKSYY